MAYSNPNTQVAIEAYASVHNLEVVAVASRINNYININCFETGEHYESRWATKLLTKGSKVVLTGGFSIREKVCEVVGVSKTTVKVNIGSREVTFNRDGVERGNSSSRFALRIVEYIEGLYEIKAAEDDAEKQAHDAWVQANSYVKNKSKAISVSPQKELTSEQMERLAALYREFDEEAKALESESA